MDAPNRRRSGRLSIVADLFTSENNNNNNNNMIDNRKSSRHSSNGAARRQSTGRTNKRKRRTSDMGDKNKKNKRKVTSTEKKLIAFGMSTFESVFLPTRVGEDRLFRRHLAEGLEILGGSSIKKVVASSASTMILTKNGGIFSVGDAEDGLLGRNIDPDLDEVLEGATLCQVSQFLTLNGVEKDVRLVDIAAGRGHWLALDHNCRLFSSGCHEEISGKTYKYASTSDGNPRGYDPLPVHIPLDKPAKEIHCVADYCWVTLIDDTIVSFGFGNGELARDGAKTMCKTVQMAHNNYFYMALRG